MLHLNAISIMDMTIIIDMTSETWIFGGQPIRRTKRCQLVGSAGDLFIERHGSDQERVFFKARFSKG